MTNYVFRFGDAPDGMKKGWTSKGYPYWYKEETVKKVVKNCKNREQLGNPAGSPPKGYDNWDDYYREINK